MNDVRDVFRALHDEACESEHPTYHQQPWLRLSTYDVTLMASAVIERLTDPGSEQ
jgi:hypothetical protein